MNRLKPPRTFYFLLITVLLFTSGYMIFASEGVVGETAFLKDYLADFYNEKATAYIYIVHDKENHQINALFKNDTDQWYNEGNYKQIKQYIYDHQLKLLKTSATSADGHMFRAQYASIGITRKVVFYQVMPSITQNGMGDAITVTLGSNVFYDPNTYKITKIVKPILYVTQSNGDSQMKNLALNSYQINNYSANYDVQFDLNALGTDLFTFKDYYRVDVWR